MRPRASSSLVLLLALVLCAACPSSAVPISSTGPSPAAASACEFFGTRFVPFPGSKVEEHREVSEPLSRVSLDGYEGTHHVLVSIIPREMRATAEPTSAAQAAQYFRSLRAGMTDWTDASESRFEAPARSYPVTFGRRLVRGPLPPLDTEQDDAVLLYFPDDFPAGRYFYVFFWTDIHVVGEQPNVLAGLKTLVDSFEVRSPPVVGAASRGCA
jgi:hypothetical protein